MSFMICRPVVPIIGFLELLVILIGQLNWWKFQELHKPHKNNACWKEHKNVSLEKVIL